jgi:DME family drug/metabolite transporter
MIGEVLAIIVALCWAFTAVLYRKALRNTSYTVTNLVRTIFAAMFLLAVVSLTLRHVSAIPLSLLSLLLLASITNLVIGDTLFFMSLKKVGVSRTQPISSSYPLFSMIPASLIIGERIELLTVIGTILILIGIVIVSLTGNKNSELRSERVSTLRGVHFSIGAALCYSIGFTSYKLVLVSGAVDPTFATFIRMTAVIPILLVAVAIRGPRQMKKLTKRDIAILAVGGILELGVGGLLLFQSLRLADASRVIPLSSTTPLFALALASRYTGEKILFRLVLGAIITVAGVMLITSSAI